MRPIETLWAGNWLWDNLNERYIIIVSLSEPMIVQSVHQEYRLGEYYIANIRIDRCPITEPGFALGTNGYKRISAAGKIIYLHEIRKLICVVTTMNTYQNPDVIIETRKTSS
ncbi:MAG TPA: hypothetical protein VK588_10920 [Chitinophagaceae bacterium]|nr:hypothetical protein [Chitinophagaceae bacterium]